MGLTRGVKRQAGKCFANQRLEMEIGRLESRDRRRRADAGGADAAGTRQPPV